MNNSGSFKILIDALDKDIYNIEFQNFVKESYNDIIQSVKEYNVLKIPTMQEVLDRIAKKIDGEIDGLINEVDIKEVNSDNDIQTLLNASTGELKLENSLTIFVGGQVLDRGITIPNMISFFYGRDPKIMQQDTVMQHCRMFGYRGDELLSVTRFYTTYRLFSSMKEITIRDNLLRERMSKQTTGEVVYLEAGGKIKACSPQKVLASEIHSILPEKRYLPIGFEINKEKAKKTWTKIDGLIKKNKGYLKNENIICRKGINIKEHYVMISSEDALEILKNAYSVMLPKEDGNCNKYKEIESVFLFSLSERIENHEDNVALIVRRDRKLGKLKRNGTMYQDAPDDGNNEGAIAKKLRSEMPVLVLTEQTNPEWGRSFWWPIYYTPDKMNVGLYSEEKTKTGVFENINNASVFPMCIESYHVIDNVGVTKKMIMNLEDAVEDISEYYDTHFYTKNFIKSIRRKKIQCYIYIDTQEVFSNNGNLVAYIEKAKKKISNILLKSKSTEFLAVEIYDYFDSVLRKKANDKRREYIIEIIKKQHLSTTQKFSLFGMIDEVDEIAKNIEENFGNFSVLGSGQCEIRLNYQMIECFCKEKGYSDRSIQIFINTILAHVMFHAIHYADIMTESGRWMYTRKDYHKQYAVKETLAEYFSLCYMKDKISIIDDEMHVIKNFYNMHNIEKFPCDGGYAGALILEKLEKDNCRGKNNDKYVDIYIKSLSDMPLAFQKIMEMKESLNKI